MLHPSCHPWCHPKPTISYPLPANSGKSDLRSASCSSRRDHPVELIADAGAAVFLTGLAGTRRTPGTCETGAARPELDQQHRIVKLVADRPAKADLGSDGVLCGALADGQFAFRSVVRKKHVVSHDPVPILVGQVFVAIRRRRVLEQGLQRPLLVPLICPCPSIFDWPARMNTLTGPLPVLGSPNRAPQESCGHRHHQRELPRKKPVANLMGTSLRSGVGGRSAVTGRGARRTGRNAGGVLVRHAVFVRRRGRQHFAQ